MFPEPLVDFNSANEKKNTLPLKNNYNTFIQTRLLLKTRGTVSIILRSFFSLPIKN